MLRYFITSLYSATVPTYADYVALPAFTHRKPLLQQQIDTSCLPGPQQRTCSNGFAAVGPCRDRQTERWADRTPYRFIGPDPHTIWAVPIMGHDS